MFDQDGYPTKVILGQISIWPLDSKDKVIELYELLKVLFKHYGSVERVGNFMQITTGGWSGNESVIDALQENVIFWTLYWESSHRGGMHVFRYPG